MKVDKSTKILINLVLILVIILLVKSLITIPRNLYAKEGKEYKVISGGIGKAVSKLFDKLGLDKYKEFNINLAKSLGIEYPSGFESVLNYYAKKGWKLHTYQWNEDVLIFER